MHKRFVRLAPVLLLGALLGLSVATPPGNASALNAEAQQLYARAEEAYKAKDLPTATKLLQEALNKEPDNAVIRYILGRVAFESGDFLGAKAAFEIVVRSRPSPDKGKEYNERLKSFKKRVKTMQKEFNEQGKQRFEMFKKNQNTPERIKLAVTAYQAFRLNPRLRYEHFKTLTEMTKVYEDALKSSISGPDWKKGPMLQLAFLYEIANKRDKAAEIYMRALDYVENPNEEFIITHRFDYLNRSNKAKLLDTIEAGEFTQQDLEELMGGEAADVTQEDRQKIDDMLAEARSKLADAVTDEERESVLEDIKANLIAKKDRGELPGQDRLKARLEKEGKTFEEYMKEKGF